MTITIELRSTSEDGLLGEVNQQVNDWVDAINADCRRDYLERQDENYVRSDAQCMGYIDCIYHGPQLGSRAFGGATCCPECTVEMMDAIGDGVITAEALMAMGGWDANKKNLRLFLNTEKRTSLRDKAKPSFYVIITAAAREKLQDK